MSFEDPKSNKEFQVPERLQFDSRKGWYKFGDVPYKIYFAFDCPDNRFINSKRPAAYLLTPDRPRKPGVFGTIYSVSVFIHESVPKNFEDLVMFHELREAELRFGKGMKTSEAHKQAVIDTTAYAKKYLSEEEFNEFNKWADSLLLE